MDCIPNAEKLCAIADYFNVSTDWLLGRTETRSPDTNERTVGDYLELTDKAVIALRPADKGGMLDGARRLWQILQPSGEQRAGRKGLNLWAAR